MHQHLNRATVLAIGFGLAVLVLGTSGCVTKRTTTQRGQVVDEKYVVKRPVKNALENLEVE
jgi:hypothetical protein